MSSLHDLLVSDLESRNLSDDGEQSAQVSELDLGFVEKVAQSVEGVLEKLAGLETEPEAPAEELDVRDYLLQKVAQVKETATTEAVEQDTEQLRGEVLQKLAHLTPETVPVQETEETTDADNQVKATLESWVAKIKEAKVEEDAPAASPASVKSVLDLMGGTDE